MDPITNQSFTKDYQNYVLQDPIVRNGYYYVEPPLKKFSIEPSQKSKKTKKDMKKNDDPDQKLSKPYNL